MSEQILKALMQLFAIIARPESSRRDRRIVVESFLRRQLNQERVEEYLVTFDKYYNIHQYKQKEKEKRRRRISSTSVRVLRICTEINDELTQKQKIIVLAYLLEFARSDVEQISDQEYEFISTVSDTFHIHKKEYDQLKDFVTYPESQIPNSSKVLVINSQKTFQHAKVRHVYADSLQGQIRVYQADIPNIYFLRYYGISELYLNGQLVLPEKVYVFNVGASLRNPKIKPIYYSDVISKFNIDRLKSKIVLDVRNVGYKFRSGLKGLHDISFSEESGKMVGIMGASGAGKTTLLNVLNGSEKPTTGKVLINKVNIHTEEEKVRGLIGYISQDDLLIEELTVHDNLYYNAKLCFDNYTEEQIKETVEQVLKNLGLFEIKDLRVGTPLNKLISGGQRKRLNIALELIREPAVLFIDEPTSGLSSRDSENIMDLLKELTLRGKLVFVVIHQPSSDIFKMFDRLVILDHGGYMIFNGDPIESIIYFKSQIQHANSNESECHICGNVNPEQIFNIVEANIIDEYGQMTSARKISPAEWGLYFKEFSKNIAKRVKSPEQIPDITFKIPNWFTQFQLFVKRDILAKLVNTQYLIISLFEAPVLAFILSYIIKYYNVNVTNKFGYTLDNNSNLPVYLVMSVIVAIFVGLTTSAEEIIKDRKILKRESFLNLSWSSYLISKISVQLIIAAIQAFTFVLIGNSIIEIKDMYFDYWLVLFSAWASANVMGLLISDSFKTVVTIYILIPFLVIPQIILSGVIVKYEKLNPQISSPGNIPWYGEIITARWAYEALAVQQFKENKYEKLFYPYDKILNNANYKKVYYLKELMNKIEYCENNYQDRNKKQKVENNLVLLRYEIKKEQKENTIIPFASLDSLYYYKLTPEIIQKTKRYILLSKRYYIRLSNEVNKQKNKLITQLQDTPEKKEAFLSLKRNFHNQVLREFVKNYDETDRIVEYNNRLIRKIDPIYKDPESAFLKAHFYAPRKKILGIFYDTYIVNIIVLWGITLIIYGLLYFRLLKKLLDFIEQIKFRKIYS